MQEIEQYRTATGQPLNQTLAGHMAALSAPPFWARPVSSLFLLQARELAAGFDPPFVVQIFELPSVEFMVGWVSVFGIGVLGRMMRCRCAGSHGRCWVKEAVAAARYR